MNMSSQPTFQDSLSAYSLINGHTFVRRYIIRKEYVYRKTTYVHMSMRHAPISSSILFTFFASE